MPYIIGGIIGALIATLIVWFICWKKPKDEILKINKSIEQENEILYKNNTAYKETQ
jgi:glycerol uptake facilitator-like aquaporin